MTLKNSVKDSESVKNALGKASDAINTGVKEKPDVEAATAEGLTDAEKLVRFVNKNGLALNKNGKTYLLAEAWQFVCRLKGLTPSFESSAEIENTQDKNGTSIRYYSVTTTCRLLDKNGVERTRSTIIATSLEQFLKDKPAYAVWGMSETRALSRAVRNVYGYIARDAGYQATPWEEID